MKRALITGASSGIGLHLAWEFAKHGHSLVLVAPNATELREIAADLHAAHRVEVHTMPKDLTAENSCAEISSELAGLDFHIEILVNNAGIGCKGNFWEMPVDLDIAMLRLNAEAVIRLTKLFLPSMVERGSGKILNTASVAGFEPGPSLAVYHATKALVLSFSEGLATELEGTGVTVTALCPGPTDTDFFPKAHMLGTRGFQKVPLMSPQEVAEAGYKAVMAGKRLAIPGASNKALVFLRRLMPDFMQAKFMQRIYQDLPFSQQTRERGDRELSAVGMN